MKFWDSSALVPLVSREPSSRRCQRLLRQDPAVVTWVLSRVEIRSALIRKRRRQGISADELRESWVRVEELAQSWSEVQSLDLAIRRALRALDLHDLRAGDALQLGAALVACGDDAGRLSFVVLDERLAKAAEREGFPVIVP